MTIMEKEDVESGPFVDAIKAEDAVKNNGLICIPRDLVWMAMRTGWLIKTVFNNDSRLQHSTHFLQHCVRYKIWIEPYWCLLFNGAECFSISTVFLLCCHP